jgi:drug/metabolite transporter (DMT)-like permease
MGIISLLSAGMVAGIAAASGESLVATSLRSNLLMLLYGIGCQGIGWLLLSLGLPHLPASRAGLLMLTQPSLAFIWDVVFFHRPTSAWGYCGAVIALGAICLGVLGKAERRDQQ